MALKFYTSVAKWLKLKERKFLGLIHAFVEITRKKLVGWPFCNPHPEWVKAKSATTFTATDHVI